MATSDRTPRNRSAAGFYWALVGALAAFGLVALLTVGIFVLAAAAALTLLAVALKIDTRALPALAIGAAAIPFYIAILNRSGPGTVCTRTATEISCGEQMSPWPWVAAGVALAAGGVILLLRTSRRRTTLPDPPYPPR